MADPVQFVLLLDPDLDQLRRFVAEMDQRRGARRRRWRLFGSDARLRGEGLEANPWVPGSWVWTLWLEGWSGTEAPERVVAPGGRFNMTPAEELTQRLLWLEELGVPEADRAQAAEKIVRGYVPEAFGSAQ